MKKMYFLAFFALFLMSAPMTVWGATYEYKCAPKKVTVTDNSSGSTYKYTLNIPIKTHRIYNNKDVYDDYTLNIILKPTTHTLEGTYTYNGSAGTLSGGTGSHYTRFEYNLSTYYYLSSSEQSRFVIEKRGDHVYEISAGTLYFVYSNSTYICNLSYDANTLSNTSVVEPFVFVDRATDNNYLMKNITSAQVQYDDINNQTQLKFNVQGVNGNDTYNYETTLLLNNTAFLTGNYAVGTEGATLDAQSTIYWPSTPTTRYPVQDGTLLSIKHISGSTYQLSGALCAKKDPNISGTPYLYNFGSNRLTFSCRLKYDMSDAEDKTAFLNQIKASEADFDLTLTRSLSKDYYNTFCSPVSGDVATLLGEDAEVYAFTSVSGNAETGYTFTFSPLEGDIEAGVPYLVKPSSDIAQIELTNVATSRLTTVPQTVTHDGFSFCGVLAPTNLSGGEYILGDGNLLYKALPGQMKGMRAYFTLPTNNGVAPRVSVKVLNQTDTPTNWEAVHSVPKTQKMLRNGRLLIHRDGKTYDILGNKQ